MGNWCTVTIEGSIDPSDAPAARAFIDITGGRLDYSVTDWDRFHCLCFAGFSMCGLGPWIPEGGGEFTVVGNLAERDYDADSVASTLRELVAIAPSLKVKVHCGGDYESTACVATVTAADGLVTLGPPEIQTVGVGMQQLIDGRTAGFIAGLQG